MLTPIHVICNSDTKVFCRLNIFHTFVEIDHEINMDILLPSAESFRKSWWQLYARVCARSTGTPPPPPPQKQNQQLLYPFAMKCFVYVNCLYLYFNKILFPLNPNKRLYFGILLSLSVSHRIDGNRKRS